MNTMQAIIDQLGKINEASSEAELLDILTQIATNRNDSGLKSHLRNLLNHERQDNQVAINVLAAGMFGICLGGKYMLANHEGGYRVYPFLHMLRKAMLACPPLRDRLRQNAKSYIFFTEFYESLSNSRQRIAAIAKAHAGADLGNDLLTVLYSLGGFFGKSETDTGLRDAKKSGGTTCVMTARAVYHAAGMKMIGEKDPSVGTPGGPQLELGVPVQKTAATGNRFSEASMLRDDQYVFGLKGFDDNNSEEMNRPHLEIGDIYYVDGDGDFKYLLRSNASIAAHVGIVVGNHGNRYVDTIDGGSGGGAKIDLNSNREVKFEKLLGWTLDKPGKSFTTGNISEVDAFMAGYNTEAAVLQWLKMNPRFGKAIQNGIEKCDKDIARLAAQPLLVKQIEKGRAAMIEGARKLIREIKKGEKTLGQDRVLKGWWKSERYSELAYCGRETLKSWLNA